ncbi:hypothetical protein [Pseudodonghicola xiamenensis]|uniref:hypothetical protein n=1 Tax=Pseudodonghicola xiamenensis TaxID=337702 RepID=UPI0003FB8B18|nr:hypothetical protein [Pseudodonghicola xiamenensis]
MRGYNRGVNQRLRRNQTGDFLGATIAIKQPVISTAFANDEKVSEQDAGTIQESHIEIRTALFIERNTGICRAEIDIRRLIKPQFRCHRSRSLASRRRKNFSQVPLLGLFSPQYPHVPEADETARGTAPTGIMENRANTRGRNIQINMHTVNDLFKPAGKADAVLQLFPAISCSQF